MNDFFNSAFILHLSAGDTVSNAVARLVFFGILALSHLYYQKQYINNQLKTNHSAAG
jgi:hypothetical protein